MVMKYFFLLYAFCCFPDHLPQKNNTFIIIKCHKGNMMAKSIV